jgi:hypothetical protein
MRTTWKSLLVGLMCCGFMTAGVYAEEEGGAPGKGEGRRGMPGKPGQKMAEMKDKFFSDVPGATAEIERHRAAMEAIRERTKEMFKEMQEKARAAAQAAGQGAGQDAENPENRREAVKNALEAMKPELEQKLKALVAEGVDEKINHHQKLLDLCKANKQGMVDKLTAKLLERGKNHHQMRKEGNGDGEMNRRGKKMGEEGRGKMRREGKDEPAAPTAGDEGTGDAGELADALEAALG